MKLVNIFSPTTNEEVLAIVALLEAREIPCFVHGTPARSLRPGMQVRARRPQTIMVPADSSAEALELITHLQSSGSAHRAAPRLPLSSRLRALIELNVFAWFAPGRGASK